MLLHRLDSVHICDIIMLSEMHTELIVTLRKVALLSTKPGGISHTIQTTWWPIAFRTLA